VHSGNVQRQLHQVQQSWPIKCVTRTCVLQLARSRHVHSTNRAGQSRVSSRHPTSAKDQSATSRSAAPRTVLARRLRHDVAPSRGQNVKCQKKKSVRALIRRESPALLAARGPRTRSRETSRMHTLWSVGKQRLSHSPDQQPTACMSLVLHNPCSQADG
jgi:hypothetical protein